MDRIFPFELDISADRRIVRDIPGNAEGRVFGFVKSGIPLPEGGAFYLVEFESIALKRVRIAAYVDKYGRAFDTDEPLEIPPARYPRFRAYAQAGTDRAQGLMVSVEPDGKESPVGAYACENSGDQERYRLEAVLGGRLPGCACPSPWLPYSEFMTMMYCAFVEFGEASGARALFDMGAVFSRLDTLSVFDAVNTEVLEAEALLAEDPGRLCDVERYLVHMLRDTGIVGLTAANLGVDLADGSKAEPVARLLRTARYANTFYVDFLYADASMSLVENGLFLSSPETAASRAMFLRVESALNRFLLLTEHLDASFEGGSAAADEAYCSAADAWLMDRICTQASDPARAEARTSRWDKHLAFARSCEALRLPCRLGYEFCSSADGGVFGVDIAVPGADIMPKSAWDEEAASYVQRSRKDREGDAARYAAHAAILFAAQAFSVSSDVLQVQVNCLRDGVSDACVIAGAFEREAFLQEFSADEAHAFTEPFAFLRACGVRLEFDEGFVLKTVDRAFSRGEGIFADERVLQIDRDDEPFSPEARELAGVFAPCDLAIFEDGKRARFAEEVVAALDSGVPAALECLKGIHDRTENILVRRICRSLMDGFELQTLDEHAYLEVKEAFVDAYGFKPLMARAAALIRADEEAQALSVLEELLAKVEATEGFVDTSATCYRYFDSYETRYMYARHCDADRAGRRVLPVPDEAFLVHDALAQVYLTSINGAEEALKHAERCIELAPARAHSYLRAARAYFMRGEFRQEIAMCARALEVAWHPNDAGLALYWMAYAFWKLERYDAAAACYRRCALLRATISEQAMVEFEELLESVKGLQRHTEAEENEILRKEGVPVGSLAANCESLLEMARASADSGCTSLCCVMAASGMRVVRDDALMPVVKSFSSAK